MNDHAVGCLCEYCDPRNRPQSTGDGGISPDAAYVVIDVQTGHEVYRTTYKHRVRARRFADRKDTEYGAVRYVARLLHGSW